MLDLKTHAIIFVTIILGLAGTSIILNAVYGETQTTGSLELDTAMIIGGFALFVLLSFSLEVLLIKLWVAGQRRMINYVGTPAHSRGPTRLGERYFLWVERNQNRVILGLWALTALTFLFTIPKMIQGGFFTPPA
jgi:hypothetical protein